MPIVVYSPHSGRPVKVREQDVGRAVRDEAGRIFYLLAKSDGSGYFGSCTRTGGDQQEQRAEQMRQQPQAPDPQAALPEATPHDATGRRRTRYRGKLVILALVVVMAVLAYLFSPYGPYHWTKVNRREPRPANHVITGDPAPPQPDANQRDETN